MSFVLIDRILDLQPGVSVTALKRLSPDEEYLQDHFPKFPVMPGVLMLEAMYQAGAWLVYETDKFAHTIVHLKEARNVKYADFVEPGQQLTVKAEILKQDEATTTLKATGTVDGKSAVSARLVLERYNLSDRAPQRAATDALTRSQMRRKLAHLWPATKSAGKESAD